MTLEEACNVLRVDPGTNDDLINSLIRAIPSFIELKTGMTEKAQENEPLVKTVSGFILQLWYFSDNIDDKVLNRTIDSLLCAITLKAKQE